MYFFFLTCEVKCGAAALDIADRQNAHSMSVALKAFVAFFRSVKREKELNQKLFFFHPARPQFGENLWPLLRHRRRQDYFFYRHPIREFSFTE